MSKTINLDEKLECKGYWWLPNNPNETVAGVLTYIPDEKILLELHLKIYLIINLFMKLNFIYLKKAIPA